MAACNGVPKNSPITCGKLKARMDFLDVEGVSSAFLIGIPEIEKLNAHIDFDRQYANFTIGRELVWSEPEPDRTIDQVHGNKLDAKAL